MNKTIDWFLLGAIVPILFFGLITMSSFTGDSNFALKQMIWIVISLGLFYFLSNLDFSFLRRTNIIIAFYGIAVALLFILFGVAGVVKGARSWLDFGFLSFEPAEFAKLALILLLAKYYSRRHVEIANFKHILISGLYSFIVFALILMHPDFGSAIIIFAIWLGMTLVSGISKRHLATVMVVGAMAFSALWFFGFKDYQKDRIISFINPLADIHRSGYNAYQSMVAVGSGEIIGKGVGYGTQSKLKFLPEYETDFIFAAFAEEWGFIGVIILFILFGIVIWRILRNAYSGITNFEILYGVGLAIMIITHFTVNIGMNIGLLPVTGVTLPFMSYGGSHLLIEFIGLGILMGMRRQGLTLHKESINHEFLGIK